MRVATMVAALLPVSCVLIVSPETHGDRCILAVEDTSCGRCLRARCQSKIDACCTNDSCGGALASIEACARRADGTCDDVASRKGRAGAEGELATCVTSLCGAVCREFAGASDTTCYEPAFGFGSVCACTSAPGAGNAFDCSPQSYADTLCCAPESWPAPGLECSCRPLSCYPTPEGCSCQLVDTPPKRADCAVPPCCVSLLDPETCSCRRRCFENERVVTSCSSISDDRTVGCGIGQKVVASCSLRRP